MSVLALFYLVVCFVFPVAQALFCWYNFSKLEDRPFVKRFGSMWEGKRTDDKGFILYNFWFIGRRLMLALLVVYAREVLFYQIGGLVF